MRTAISGLSAFVAGAIFGVGLIVSEMANPKRVQGFLDITGQWDPTLMFVMAGALVVTGVGYQLIFKRDKPLFSDSFSVPVNRLIDRKLLIGAAIFGAGWGLSGLCPAPAVVGVSTGSWSVAVFVIAMTIGMKAYELLVEKN